MIALGSNVGDREDNLRRAIGLMARYGNVGPQSSVYETEPMYQENQDWFLNSAVSLETELGPRALLEALKSIEIEVGRQDGPRFGPRAIDLDILFYDDRVVSEPDLQIPHPRLAERLFVLAPLVEIEPNLVHPVLHKKVSELLSELRTDKRVLRLPWTLSDRS